MSTSSRGVAALVSLETLKPHFKDAYINTFQNYVASDSMAEIVDAIKNRHSPQSRNWTVQEISHFLSDCHDEQGKLKRDFKTSNPVFSYIVEQGAVRYEHFFGNFEEPSRLDDLANDRGRFLLDALHMDIVAKLQLSDPHATEVNPAGADQVTALENSLAPTLQPGYQGTEAIVAANTITHWSLEAVTERFSRRPVQDFSERVSRQLTRSANSPQLTPVHPKGKESASKWSWNNFFAFAMPAISLGLIIGGVAGSVIPFPGLGTLAGAFVGVAIGLGVALVASAIKAAFMYSKLKKEPALPTTDSSSSNTSSYSLMIGEGLTPGKQNEHQPVQDAQLNVKSSRPLIDRDEREDTLDSPPPSDSSPEHSLRL